MKDKKEDKRPEDKTEKRLAYLERKVQDLVVRLEKQMGIDLNDNDLIGGYAKLGLIFGLCVAMVGGAFAAETLLRNEFATEGNDAVWQLEADEGDDAADELQIIMKAVDAKKTIIGIEDNKLNVLEAIKPKLTYIKGSIIFPSSS